MPSWEACWPWCLSFPSLWNGWDKKGPCLQEEWWRMESGTKEPWWKDKRKQGRPRRGRPWTGAPRLPAWTTQTLAGLSVGAETQQPLWRQEGQGCFWQSLRPRGPQCRRTPLPHSCSVKCTLIGKEAIQGRIWEGLKLHQVCQTWHSGAMWGKEHTLT